MVAAERLGVPSPGRCLAVLAGLEGTLTWPAAGRSRRGKRNPGSLRASKEACEVFAGFGEEGVTAESIAADTVRAVCDYVAARVPVGEYLADQLLVPLAIGAGSEFRTLPLSRHARTNMDVLRRFGFDAAVEEDGGSVVVRVKG